MNQSKWLFGLGLLGASGVIFGAFGAHALREVLSPQALQSYQTGVNYQFYHSLALGLCLVLQGQGWGPLVWAKRLFLLGILLFSGSIYLLACRDLLGIGAWQPILGPLTPLGGLAFVAAWLALALRR